MSGLSPHFDAAQRLKSWALSMQANVDYVKAEQAESSKPGAGSSWMDCIPKEDIERDEQRIADLMLAASVLQSTRPAQDETP